MYASGKGFEIYSERIPVNKIVKSMLKEKAVKYALNSGEGYELLFTVDEKEVKDLNFDFSIIGRAIEDKKILLDGKKLKEEGYDHFARSDVL